MAVRPDSVPRSWCHPGRGRREPQTGAGDDASGVRVDEATVRAPHAGSERPDQAARSAALVATTAGPGSDSGAGAGTTPGTRKARSQGAADTAAALRRCPARSVLALRSGRGW